MVFSSIPVYVDPPNWQHQQPTHHHHHHQANGSELLPPLPPQVGGGGSSGGSIRPGSMADRARLAKIPPPEAALKCPRCDSTNTKFCYFNNYSLSQPRHFCKTCRRYWTRGGALRNVPVGGGCRRNKKNKRSRSKSPANTSHDKQQTLSTTSSTAAAAAATTTHELIGQLPQPTNLPFMASLQNLNRYSVGNMGLGLREIQGQTTDHMGFQMANSNSVSGVDQWRLQQFPFLNGFESGSGGSFPFQSEGEGLVGDISTSNRVTQLPSVKMEENGALNLTRAPLGGTVSEHNQFYSWSDMSGLASNSSTTHLL